MGIIFKTSLPLRLSILRQDVFFPIFNCYKSLSSYVSQTGLLDYSQNILSGYAQVYFSKKWLVGLLFCLSTFVVPHIGAAGLAGLLLSTFFARVLGLSKDSDDGVYFAYNGLLTALSLGLTYQINISSVVMLILSMFLCVLISSALRTLFEKYFSIPVLSMPFIITSWIIIAAGRKFQGLIFTIKPFEIEVLNGFFPEPVEFMFRSFGAAFFQLSVPSGILVALGILIYSRHAFIVASLAVFFASSFHIAVGGSMTDLNSQWIGFNFALTAIGVGGMFVVPGIGSYVLALMSALISSVVAAGALMVLDPLGLPVLAFPFVFTTLIILYPLRNRVSPRFLKSITHPKDSPETNLKHYKNPRACFVSDETPAFSLPVCGKWKITQGFNGSETHKDFWAQALDFEVTDEMGKTYTNRGGQLSDYYSWNMPVFSPGDGIVTKVIKHIDDNGIGQVNTKNNWGNTVIIWHYGTVYSSLSHLANDSVCVSEGETIRRGKVIGKVGNSGRSPSPHLHLQVQYSPELGAHTVPFNILNYISKETGRPDFHIQGVPCKNQVIEAVQADGGMFDAASFPIGGRWGFSVYSKNKRWQETWYSEIDFIGNRFLRCKETKAILHFFLNNNVLLLLDYQGPSNTALEWLFLAAPTIPFTRQTAHWYEKMPAERLLSPLSRLVFDCVEPVYDLASLCASLQFTSMGTEQFTINTRLSLQRGCISTRISNWEVETEFGRHRGLISLHATCSGDTILRVSQRSLL